MNKKIIISVIIIGVIAAIVIFALNNAKNSVPENNVGKINQNQNTETAPANITLQDGNNIITDVTPDQVIDLTGNTDSVKEIAMTSFTEIIDGKYKPQFSKKQIVVNKGDKVRMKITVTNGTHDFKIDEFNVYADTKELNKEYVVEFTADKAGEFTYYCTKPGHRQNGQWGIIKVLDQ